MNKNVYRWRAAVAVGFTMSMLYLSAMFLLLHAGVLPGPAAVEREALQSAAQRSSTLEGTFFAADGEPLTDASVPGKAGKILYPSTGRVIGYASARWGASGLRARWKEFLFDTDVKEKNAVRQGACVYTTLDIELSELAASLLADTAEGSIVVLNARSGEVLAAVSRQNGMDYDANAISEGDEALYAQYLERDGFLLPGMVAASQPGGSTTKLITAAHIVQTHMGEEYVDTGEEPTAGDMSVHNAGGKSYGKMDLQKAVVKSANTYFAHYGMQAGTALLNTFAAFGYNKDIPLADIGWTVRMALHPDALAGDRDTIARTAYGYKMVTSPLMLAAQYGVLVNDGHIMVPRFVREVVRTNAKGKPETLYQGEATVFSTPVEAESLPRLREVFGAAAASYGLTSSRYTLYAKTGTSENTVQRGKDNIWMAAALEDPVTGEAYSLVVCRFGVANTSSHSLSHPVNTLIAALEKHSI